MTYREKLEKYKKGTLSNVEQSELEKEIEKIDSISDYLYNTDSIDDFNVVNFENQAKPNANDFTRTIKLSIRKAFIKLGVTVSVIVLVIVLFVVYLLPQMASNFYYNPLETINSTKSGTADTKRIDLDLAVYTELFTPGAYRDNAIIEEKGYGVYNITIPQLSTFDGNTTTISGNITRNKLLLYNPDVFKEPVSNAFSLLGNSFTVHTPLAAGSEKESYKSIEKLDDNTYYQAYFSLKQPTDFSEFYDWYYKQNFNCGDLWCGIFTSDTTDKLMGIAPEAGTSVLSWDYEKYPKLRIVDGDDVDNIEEARNNKTAIKDHIISMLKYLKEHPDTCEVFKLNCSWDSPIDYIEKNGVKTYGFIVTAQKEAIKAIANSSNISYVYTEPKY